MKQMMEGYVLKETVGCVCGEMKQKLFGVKQIAKGLIITATRLQIWCFEH